MHQLIESLLGDLLGSLLSLIGVPHPPWRAPAHTGPPGSFSSHPPAHTSNLGLFSRFEQSSRLCSLRYGSDTDHPRWWWRTHSAAAESGVTLVFSWENRGTWCWQRPGWRLLPSWREVDMTVAEEGRSSPFFLLLQPKSGPSWEPLHFTIPLTFIFNFKGNI